jgi:hypothetical protein
VIVMPGSGVPKGLPHRPHRLSRRAVVRGPGQ